MKNKPRWWWWVRSVAFGSLVPVFLIGCRGGTASDQQVQMQRLGDDLIGGGASVSVSEAVAGDVILVGGEIRFAGGADGDYLGAGGEQTITGTVGGSARAAGGEVTLDAEVGRNVSLAGGRIDVTPNALIHGNVYAAGGEIRLGGVVDGGARIVGGEVTLEGTWGGDVSVQAGRLAVGPEARIEGTLRYRVPAENVSIDPAAAVVGEVVPLQPRSPMNWRWLAAIWHIGFLAAGAVAVAVLPGFARASSGRLQARPGASAGFGLLWLVAVPVAALVAALTIVGIPLALILFALYLIVVYLARSVVAVWLGDQVLRDRASVGRGGMVVRFLAGGVMLGLAALLPLVGPLVTLAATVLGLGAAWLALRRDRTGIPPESTTYSSGVAP